MSELLAWVRNVLIALAALTLFAGVATQLLAAIFGYAAHFGEHTPPWFSFPLYEPWRFLKWGLSLAAVRPWIAFLCILLALTFVLAAFAVLVLAGLVAPDDLPQFRSGRGFANWDILGQRGLLGANGLALGAVRRHWWTKSDIVSQASGNVALVGEPKHTDAALITAASTWPGPLVVIDTRGLASKLPRKGVIRFAPGQNGSFSYNPMLAIRGGVHAWADALMLAQSFLQASDNALTETFAVLLLDQLINAPLEQRHLTTLRKRLAAPHRILTEVVPAWPEELCAAAAPHSEIARAVRSWRTHPNATLAHIADIDAALVGFDGGDIAQATMAHQFRFADLTAGAGPRTLVLSIPSGEATVMARLLSAMLAQLVAACARAPGLETPGSPEQRQVLIVVEAGALPLWRQILPAEAAARGCHLLVQAPSLEHAASDAFGTIAAIGPQSDPTADKLSARAGHISEWLLLRRDEVSIRNWVFPRWVKVQRQVLPAADLTEADSSQAIVFFQGLTPVRARSLYLEGSQATFRNGTDLEPAAHDWGAPPPPMEPPTQAASAAPATSPLIGAQIRAVLTRRAPPRAKAKAVHD